MEGMPEVAMPENWRRKNKKGEFVVAVEEVAPAIGQNVIYAAHDGRFLSASIVALLPDGMVELRVNDPLSAHGCFRASPVEHDASKSIGMWHYPEE